MIIHSITIAAVIDNEMTNWIIIIFAGASQLCNIFKSGIKNSEAYIRLRFVVL